MGISEGIGWFIRGLAYLFIGILSGLIIIRAIFPVEELAKRYRREIEEEEENGVS